MAEAESPKKRPRLETADDERSNDTDLFDDQDLPFKESEDDATILASQSSSEPWQQWTIEQVAEQLSNGGIPEDAVQKFRGEHLWLMERKGLNYQRPDRLKQHQDRLKHYL